MEEYEMYQSIDDIKLGNIIASLLDAKSIIVYLGYREESDVIFIDVEEFMKLEEINSSIDNISNVIDLELITSENECYGIKGGQKIAKDNMNAMMKELEPIFSEPLVFGKKNTYRVITKEQAELVIKACYSYIAAVNDMLTSLSEELSMRKREEKDGE